MLSAVRISFHMLSTPVGGHPLPISLSGNLRNGLGINTTMKKFFFFVPVQVVFENTHTLNNNNPMQCACNNYNGL